MEKTDYLKRWYNPAHGLELKPDVNDTGKRETNENGKLFDVQYKLLQKMKNIGPTEEEIKVTKETLKKNRSYRADGVTQVDGLYDRSQKESINGSPHQRADEHRVRTISRDEMQGICVFSQVFSDGSEATHIADMMFKSIGRFPNHEVESLFSFKELLKPSAWANIQLQPADYVFYLLMSNKTLHNLLGLLLFPIYYVSQFSTPNTISVTRPTPFDAYFDKKKGKFIGYETLPANSGDGLAFVRDSGLSHKYGNIYKKIMTPVYKLYEKKWNKVWYANALYEYHHWRDVHFEFPVLTILEKEYSIVKRVIPMQFEKDDPRYEAYIKRRRIKYGDV